MLERAKIFGVISVLALSLAACGDNSGTATNETTPSDNSTTAVTPAASPVADKTTTTASASIPGVKSLSEVNLKPAPTNTKYGAGVFDLVNNSPASTHKVSKATPINLAGWAILPTQGKPADNVIITLADNKTVVAVAPLNVARPDVAKALNNPAYKNTGWSVRINPSTLPTDKVVLKAWAYDSASKEATPLSGNHNLDLSE